MRRKLCASCLVQNHKILSNFDKCFGDDEVIQHWQQKLKWLSSCGLLWIYDPFLFSWSSSTKEKGRPYYTLGALLVSSRKSRHAWFTSTRDVMSPSPFCAWTQRSPPSVPPHSDHPLWCHPPLLRLSSYLPLRSLISPSPTSGSSYFPLSNPATTTTTTTTSSREEKTQCNRTTTTEKSLKWVSDMKTNRKIRPKQWVL